MKNHLAPEFKLKEVKGGERGLMGESSIHFYNLSNQFN
jgi:hypothetical protein